MTTQRPARNWPVILTACFALVWIVHRAIVQSITLDEANTFIFWVSPTSPAHWSPHTNNHVLNSILMRLSIWLFGLSQLAVRLPALLGGALYIFTVYRFCALRCEGLALRWALFVCFVFNPFLMDYLVAARGYALALGFLSLAMYLMTRMLVRAETTKANPSEPEILRHATAISVCAALSFSANFSFAYANAFLVLVYFAWAWREQRKRGGIACVRLALACPWPGLLVAFVVTGSVLAKVQRGQFEWGTRSLKTAWEEIQWRSFAVFDQFNTAFVNPLIADLLVAIRPHIVTLGALLLILYLALLRWSARQPAGDAKPRLLLPGALGAVLYLTVIAHFLQFKLFRVPLPLERTSLWFVLVLTALVGAVFSVPPSNRAQRAVRGLGVGVVCITAIFFFAALRDSHFAEWRAGADVKTAFPVLVDLCRRAGIREVMVDADLVASLNFYRILQGLKELDEFRDEVDPMPPGKPVYVLSEGRYGKFIRSEGLQIAYHGPTTDLVIAVQPNLTR